MVMVRYADDLVVGFQRETDARRFWDAMRERLREFSLSLHPDKTRLIEFGRFAAQNRKRRGLRQAGNLQVPGLCAHLRKIPTGQLPDQEEVTSRPHASEAPGDQGSVLRQRHHSQSRNREIGCASRHWLFRLSRRPDQRPGASAFRYHVITFWHKALSASSQRAQMMWTRMAKLANEFLPKPRILHPWPSVRFAVRHPR